MEVTSSNHDSEKHLGLSNNDNSWDDNYVPLVTMSIFEFFVKL